MTRSVSRLELHNDRYFDSDPAFGRAGREIYERTRGLPLICPTATSTLDSSRRMRRSLSRPRSSSSPITTSCGTADATAIRDYGEFIEALADRRRYFKAMGATATDHGVVEPFTDRLSDDAAAHLFHRATHGDVTEADQRTFEGHMLMEMARMSLDDGLVMQLHPGSLRDHNTPLAARFGPNVGGDIPIATEYTRNLRPILNAYGVDPRFTLIVFTLDESTYARELAPLAGHYPALRLGPPWWFHDSIEGMIRFRQQTPETAGIYNTVGFNDDTRAFCSIPARHDLARRIDANYLGGLVARHIIGIDDAHVMARALAYELPKEAYKL